MGYSTGIQNKRVAVFSPANDEKAFGRERTFEYVGTFWMAEDFNRGTKSLREGALDAYDRVMFRCRAYISVKRTSMLVYQGVTYQIESFNIERRANQIQITAVEAPGKDFASLIPYTPSSSDITSGVASETPNHSNIGE